nr:helix-turn-helix transcriptional regulator [Nocardia bovistercoris]
MRIGDLSVTLGLSPKRLTALFDDEVGLSPKAYARIRRLHFALRELRTGRLPAAVVAAEAGYFDQAHLHRDLRAFTALTPAQYRLRRIRLPHHVPIDE